MKWHVGQEVVSSNDYYGVIEFISPNFVKVRFKHDRCIAYFDLDGQPSPGCNGFGCIRPRLNWKESASVLALPLTFAAGVLYGWLQWG